MRQRILLTCLGLALIFPVYALGRFFSPSQPDDASIQSCEVVLARFNQDKLHGQLDTDQLIDIVRTLNKRNQLPSYFITKKEATQLGWHPGLSFNRFPALRGKSIGGDRFGNYERQLPFGDWKEADLNYRGEKRNAKRIVFTHRGDQYVTIDHYQQFHKVPSCQ